MIDFRYHIVSIVAVFLALALGLVLGTTTINPLVVGDLKSNVTQLVNDKRALQADVETLRQQANDGTAFARAATVPLVADQLTGRGVVVIALPGVPSGMRDDLLGLLTKAGAHVTARVTLTDVYADPAQSAALDAAVTASTPAGLVLSGTSPSQRSAELLAAVLTRPATLPGGLPSSGPSATPAATKTRPAGSRPATSPPSTATGAATGTAATPTTAGSPRTTPTAKTGSTPPPPALQAGPPTPDETAGVLSGYATAGLLTVDAGSPSAADLVLVLTPDGPADGQPSATADFDRYVDLLGALVGAQHAGVVVAGPTTSVVKGVVDYVRRSSVANLLSTVDAAETPAGSVATIRALRSQLFGTVGRYGAATGDLPLPPAAEGQ